MSAPSGLQLLTMMNSSQLMLTIYALAESPGLTRSELSSLRILSSSSSESERLSLLIKFVTSLSENMERLHSVLIIMFFSLARAKKFLELTRNQADAKKLEFGQIKQGIKNLEKT